MIIPARTMSVASLVLFILLAYVHAQATSVEYDLTINQQEVNITGKSARSMTINGGIPGPVLRFKEGDTARIHVHNDMSVDTSIHWHGVLVPPGMDGVPYLSFPPIEPGGTFAYEFPSARAIPTGIIPTLVLVFSLSPALPHGGRYGPCRVL